MIYRSSFCKETMIFANWTVLTLEEELIISMRRSSIIIIT